MESFKDEVLELIEKLEEEIQDMRENGETDLRSVILEVRSLYASVVRLEEDGDYLNG